MFPALAAVVLVCAVSCAAGCVFCYRSAWSAVIGASAGSVMGMVASFFLLALTVLR
jgi:hypothetical protein